MKKHILGFAVFSLIVGSVVFVSAMFYKPIKKEYVYEVSKQYCIKEIPQESNSKITPVKIVQAVFNSKTKQIDIEFSTPADLNIELELVYMKPGKSESDSMTSVIMTQDMTIKPNSDHKSIQSLKLNGSWVNGLTTTDTMYVTIKSPKGFYVIPESVTPVDTSAVPVLIIAKQ